LVRARAAAWAIGRAGREEIDELNILQASLLAMQRAVAQLRLVPAELLIDGNRCPELPGFAGSVRAVVGGDRQCNAIAAASIVAKVARDREMIALDRDFPEYGFARHKGYPTVLHLEALARHGPCAAHRHSFRPVRESVAAREIVS